MFKVGDRVKVKALGGCIHSIRPSVVEYPSGKTTTSFTVILDVGGPNMVQCWPVTVKEEDLKLICWR